VDLGGISLGKASSSTSGGDIAGEKNFKSTINLADLETIKNYVQDISRNANPISKTIEFLQDDIESMNKELQNWIREGKQYKEQYEEEIK
jgi:TRAF3-interacting protein 1